MIRNIISYEGYKINSSMATMAKNVITAGAENRPSMLEKSYKINSSMATMAKNVIAAGAENRPSMLEKGTKMTLQEHESKLYDEFDRFTSEPEESIHSYYLRYAKLINDINIIKMPMNLHVVNFDQLYAFLKHNEKDAKEVREMRLRFPDPLALLANTYNPPLSYIITQQIIQSPPQQSYVPPVVPQQQPILPTQPDSRFVVPSFLPTNDPIASLNKAMIFLSSTFSSRYPPINNQLRTSSNLRTQPTIQNGQDTVQNVQGRHSQGCAGNAGKKWFKYKMLLAQAQEAGVDLNEDQQDFLADKLEENDDCDDLQQYTTTNFKADHVDAYDSDYDDEATASAIFMASLSPAGSISGDIVGLTYDSDILSEVPHYDTYHENDVLNSDVQETEYIEHSFSNDDSYDELTSNNNVISYVDYMVTIENDYFVPQKQLSAEQVYWAPVSKPSLPEKVTNFFPKKLPSTSQAHKNLQNARDLLDKFDDCSKKGTTLSPYEIGNWETTDIKGAFKQDVILFFKNLRETFKLFEMGLHKETRAKTKLQTSSVQQKLNDQISKNNKLRAQLQAKFSESQVNQNGISVNTKFAKPPTSGNKLYSVTPFLKTQFIPKVVDKNDLSKIVTSHLTTNKIIEKCTKVLAPSLLKIKSEPINAYFKNNRAIYRDYLKVNNEHIETLPKLLEQAIALKPLGENLVYALKFTERIRELSVYVSASCPFTQRGNEKWAHVTSHKKNKSLCRCITKISRRVIYTNASGSKSRSSTKNDRIQRPLSRSKKNKVEAQLRKFKSSLNKNNSVSDCNVNVKNVVVSKNSANVCLSCNECLFAANHDACVVKYLKDVQKHKKAKSAT
ncbi:hypothetical protein Tco_1102453 [Tanacetum coccineum]